MAAKAVKASELRGVPEAELKTQIETLRKEMWQHRIKVSTGAAQQMHRQRQIRRQIARTLTIINEQRNKA